MFGIGIWELVTIFLIILLVYGGKKLPEIATGLGIAIKNFKNELLDNKKDNKKKKIKNKINK